MAYIYTNIVGMRFLNLSASVLSSIDVEKTVLVPEPTNSYDSHAVKCVFNNIHFGYIEKKKSKEVTNQLAYFDGYRIKLIKSGENYYSISITFRSKGQSTGSGGDIRPGSTYIRGGSTQNPTVQVKATSNSGVPKKKAKSTLAIDSTRTNNRPTERRVNPQTRPTRTTSKPTKDESDSLSWIVWLIIGLVVFAVFSGSDTDEGRGSGSTGVVTPVNAENGPQPAILNLPRNAATGRPTAIEPETLGIPILGLPANARFTENGSNWECLSGFRRVGQGCERR